MSKLIPMEEAAKILGLSVEKLNELRSNNEVFGYRDGSTWKFKMSELERVANDMGLSISSLEGLTVDGIAGVLGLSGDEGDSSELDLGLDESSQDLFMEPDSDSIAMDDSSVELFQTPLGSKDGGTSSDIFSGGDDEDDVIDLAESGLLVKNSSKDMLLDKGDEEDDELSLFDSSDDLKLEDSGLKLKSDGDDSFKLTDDSVLDGDDDLSFGSSSLELASEVKSPDSPSATGDDLLNKEPSSGAPSTGKLVGGDDDDLSLAGDEDLFDDDLDLADSASFESSEISSEFEESGDMVLEDSDSSGELTLEANESGIALSANESGIALGNEPLELGGSDIDELELPEDDDIVLVDDVTDADSATLMQEDDFNLTPHEMSLDDDDDSSGSQVIALAESEIYADDSAATVLSGDSFADQSFDDGDAYDPAAAGMVGVGAAGMAAAAAGGIAAEEVGYSKWQIGGLALTAFTLFLGTIVAYGTAQNLWMPDDEVVSSGIMKMFIDSLGMN